MSNIRVVGNKPLHGEVDISGSLNSALKLVIASLYTTEEVFLSNIPNVELIKKELEILSSLGGEYEWVSKNLLRINNSKLTNFQIPLSLGKNLNTAYLFAGPLLFRFGEAQIPIPDEGIDAVVNYLNTWSMLNIEINFDKEFIYLRSDNAKFGRVEFERPSQMQTVNAIFSSIFLNGTTTLINTSEDIEIEDTIKFLTLIGAGIKRVNKKVIEITGVTHFKSDNYSCMPEVSEAVFFSVLSLVTNGNILIKNIDRPSLSNFVSVLNKIEANYEFVGTDSIKVWRRDGILKSFEYNNLNLPGFTNNYLAFIVFLALKCSGTSKFTTESYKNKFEYIYILNRFNSKIKIYDTGKDYESCEIFVNGVTDLIINEVEVGSFINSQVFLLAALCSENEVEIYNYEKMEYIFENLINKIINLGGNIKYD